MPVNMEENQLPTPKSDRNYITVLGETLRTIVIVFALAFLLRFFIFQPYKVEGRSMEPRFENNNHLIVEKIGYRFTKPKRGDIIVFHYPNDPEIDFVKRIIGLPGEEIQIANGQIKIINQDHPNGFVLDESLYLDDSVATNLPSIRSNQFTVTPDHFFVLGDNRPASSDSREWGLLPRENIIGRVIMRTFPLKDIGLVTHARY